MNSAAETLPYIQELLPAPSVDAALTAISDWPNVVLLESVLKRPGLGRYSFLTADPYELIETPWDATEDRLNEIEALLQRDAVAHVDGLPPFQGGAIGLLTYEFGRCFERLPSTSANAMQIPQSVVGLYDWTLAWDHEQGRCWFIGHGYPEETESLRLNRAECQYRSLLKALTLPPNTIGTWDPVETRAELPFASHPVAGVANVVSNFSHEGYLQAIEQVIEYIRAGDIFQANLAQQLFTTTDRSPVQNYLRLREENPATFNAYFSHDDWAVLSSSPERFLQVEDRRVSTRPIKGTRQRQSTPEADLYTRDELRQSQKDRSENVMIVDLLRNDLSRICSAGTVKVTELCQVETYETVSHLVSEVVGQLKPDSTFRELIQATFPGGSITGAPKIRAMEIITELEQLARGPYCGSLFYHSYSGRIDSSILIRTMTQRDGWLSLPAGGGIVVRSQPESEYQETLHKAKGMLRTLPPEKIDQ